MIASDHLAKINGTLTKQNFFEISLHKICAKNLEIMKTSVIQFLDEFSVVYVLFFFFTNVFPKTLFLLNSVLPLKLQIEM